MKSRRISRLSLQLMIVDAVLIPVAIAIAGWLRWNLPFGQELSRVSTSLPWAVYLIIISGWSISLLLAGAYDPERVLRWFQEAWRVLIGSLLATIVSAGALYFSYRTVSRLQFIYIWLLVLLLVLSHRAILRISYRLIGKARPGSNARILIVGAGSLGQQMARVIRDHSRWGYNLVGYLDDDLEKQGREYEAAPVLGKIFEVQQVVRSHNIDELWITLPVWALDRIDLILKEVEAVPVRIKVVPDYFSFALVQAKTDVLGGIPVIGLREPVIEGLPRLGKRIFDLFIGSLMLAFSLPIFLLIAIAIKLDSSGPVLFRQDRIGENGRIFSMWKFRTMVVGAESMQGEVNLEGISGEVIHKRRDDPRVTRVGRFLRRLSLDELPQLFNVLKGEMSLVGPRPEVPWLVDRYDSWQRKRFAVPQGITGWWQINGRSDKPMHLHTEDDLYYVYNYSLWLDMVILLRTPIAALRGRGAF
jgi:exopolysaccharide biosynthesis polyprenyl glycosylphosphotransferase